MKDLGNFKGCAYGKFYYDPYKTDWVYFMQSDSDREMLVLAELVLVDERAQIPASQPHLELLVPHVVKGGGREHLPYAAALKLLRNDSGEEVQDQVGFPAFISSYFISSSQMISCIPKAVNRTGNAQHVRPVKPSLKA